VKPGLLFGAALWALGGFQTLSATANEIQVDLELVLAVDVSRSIDVEEARLQREGTVAALRDPEVINAIRSGFLGKIAVSYVDYSSPPFNVVIVDWRVIDGTESANAFADTLIAAELTFGRRTSISSAIEIGAQMLENNGFAGTRQVIDISGDGPNNWGTLVNVARDLALRGRVTINGLPIMNDNGGIGGAFNLPDLDRYYQGCVIGGPGAFIVVARDFKDFARAVRRKLIFEIAGMMPPEAEPRGARIGAPLLTRAATTPGHGYTYEPGCDIGERIWQRIWGNQGEGFN
jgi:hypothetical protein